MKVLVTGASGFLAGHIVLQLIEQGAQVRGTVRSAAKAERVRQALANAGATLNDSNLEFVEADLVADAGWQDAATGCDYVMHVASPFGPKGPVTEDDFITPAREGTLRVLLAARDAGVKRVVVTSSFGAIGYGHDRNHPRFTEADWTDVTAPIAPYIKSKALAERAAWDFVKEEGGDMELSVVNPVGIFGPVLADISPSIQIVKRMLEGAMPFCPRTYFGVVDARDAADLHLRAMKDQKAAGERFIGVAGDCVSMLDVSKMLRKHLGERAKRAPRFQAPDWLIRLLAKRSPELTSVANELGRIRLSSNRKAIDVLGWKPRSTENAIVASAESLLSLGLIDAA